MGSTGRSQGRSSIVLCFWVFIVVGFIPRLLGCFTARLFCFVFKGIYDQTRQASLFALWLGWFFHPMLLSLIPS
jgi:hypothetical protein